MELRLWLRRLRLEQGSNLGSPDQQASALNPLSYWGSCFVITALYDHNYSFRIYLTHKCIMFSLLAVIFSLNKENTLKIAK